MKQKNPDTGSQPSTISRTALRRLLPERDHNHNDNEEAKAPHRSSRTRSQNPGAKVSNVAELRHYIMDELDVNDLTRSVLVHPDWKASVEEVPGYRRLRYLDPAAISEVIIWDFNTSSACPAEFSLAQENFPDRDGDLNWYLQRNSSITMVVATMHPAVAPLLKPRRNDETDEAEFTCNLASLEQLLERNPSARDLLLTQPPPRQLEVFNHPLMDDTGFTLSTLLRELKRLRLFIEQCRQISEGNDSVALEEEQWLPEYQVRIAGFILSDDEHVAKARDVWRLREERRSSRVERDRIALLPRWLRERFEWSEFLDGLEVLFS